NGDPTLRVFLRRESDRLGPLIVSNIPIECRPESVAGFRLFEQAYNTRSHLLVGLGHAPELETKCCGGKQKQPAEIGRNLHAYSFTHEPRTSTRIIGVPGGSLVTSRKF